MKPKEPLRIGQPHSSTCNCDVCKAYKVGGGMKNTVDAVKSKMHEASPISEYFSLSYANFLTIPRLVMESMSTDWQKKMKDLLEEMDETFDWAPREGCYYVQLWTNEDDEESDRILEDAPLWNYRRGNVEYLRIKEQKCTK